MESTWGGLDAFAKAEIHARLGENEKALAWLKRAFRERLPGMSRLKIEPAFNELRTEEEFNDLLRRIGFEKG